jgi:hypothetical protein
MKPLALIVATLAGLAFPAAASTQVDVSISVGDPNFYGHIDIGNFPQPVLVSPQPVVIERVRPGVVVAPLYLRVPPGHIKHWSKHCREYNACGRQVYFVDDRWYRDVYAPRYREHGDRDERHDDDRHDDRHDHGHGHGHKHDHDRD